MRVALYILLAVTVILSVGYWALTAGQSDRVPLIGGDDAAAPSTEDRYAPAGLTTATLSENGQLNLSGTAIPKTTVTILADAELLQSVRAGSDGAWKADAKIPAARIRRRVITLTLQSDLGDDSLIGSEESLLVLTEPVDFKQGLFMVRPGAATRVLQTPFGTLPKQGGLTIEAADYDDAGGIIFSGRSDIPGRIRLSAGKSVLGETGPDANGRWTLISSAGLPVGTYPMRLQLISENNAGIAQIDVPFTRNPPITPVNTIEQDGLDFPAPPKASAQFDETRWTITRPLSGGGMQHTIIWSPAILEPADAPDGDQ